MGSWRSARETPTRSARSPAEPQRRRWMEFTWLSEELPAHIAGCQRRGDSVCKLYSEIKRMWVEEGKKGGRGDGGWRDVGFVIKASDGTLLTLTPHFDTSV